MGNMTGEVGLRVLEGTDDQSDELISEIVNIVVP